MKMKILVKPKIETCGKERYFPDCPLSRALCISKVVKGRRENPHILPQDVQAFIHEDIKVEYTGRRNEVLDKLGAVKIDE